MTQETWHTVEAIVHREAHEAIEYGLMEAGALGTETREAKDGCIHVTGYFVALPQVERARSALLDALRIYNFAPASLINVKLGEIPNRDWLAEWKKHWQPVEVGRFIIAPPWSVPPASAGGFFADRIVIRIDPGMAFGTGTHETTLLCLKAIEKHFLGGSFIDVGTGTGILAIAAVKLFPDARVEAYDTDAEVIASANENARLNGIGNQIKFRVGSIDEQTPSADLVCANLTAPAIIQLLPLLLGVTCGRLILSGILGSQIEMVTSRLVELGAAGFEFDTDGEWIALAV